MTMTLIRWILKYTWPHSAFFIIFKTPWQHVHSLDPWRKKSYLTSTSQLNHGKYGQIHECFGWLC